MQRILPVVFACLLPAAAHGADTPAAVAPGDSVIERLEVKRAETRVPEHSSLRFLKDHRVFIRSQLDRLRTQVTREHTQPAELLDARYLRLREMSDAIAAAQDTIGGEEALAAQRALFASVTELGRLENSLDLMDSLLVDQRRRLLWLEQDFLGHQETALVIVIRNLPRGEAPTGIAIAEEGEIAHTPLTPAQCASLAQGGIAQIYHEFVEPRAHTISVQLEGGEWQTLPPATVALEAPRDRIAFLELDLGAMNRTSPSQGLLTRVWYR